jgi:hypothetical protein
MLSARWEQKIQPLSLLSHMPNLSIRPQPLIEATIANAACLSLTHTKNEFSSTLNLRAGKFKAASKAHSIQWETFIRPLKIASVVYIFALLSFVGQYFFLNQQLEQVGLKQDQALTEIFGKSTASFLLTLKSSEVKLKQQVQKKVEELSGQLAGGGETRSIPSLDILDGLSRAIPKSTTVEIREFKLSAGQIQLKLESPTQKDLENALRLISTAPKIASPQVLPIENLNGGRKRVLVNARISGGNS